MGQYDLILYHLTLQLIFKYTIYQETLSTNSELFLIIALEKGPLLCLISVSQTFFICGQVLKDESERILHQKCHHTIIPLDIKGSNKYRTLSNKFQLVPILVHYPLTIFLLPHNIE